MSRPIGVLQAVRARAGLVALCAAFVVCWSSGFVGAKVGTTGYDVLTVLLWRMLPLAAGLLVLTAVLRRRARRRSAEEPRASVGRGRLLRQVGVGALSQSGYLLSVYWAVALGVSTGTTALVDGLQPLVVAALTGPLLGVAVRGRQWVGLAAGLAGVLLVTWADATSPRTGAPGWAYAVPLAGMLSLVAATFLQRRDPSPPRPLGDLAVHSATSAVLFSGLALAAGAATVPGELRFWLATAWLVVLPTFGGYGLYWLLLERVGVTTVGSLLFLVPPVTTAWGAVAFGEPVTPLTVAGLVLALLATGLVGAGDGAGRGAPAAREGARRPVPAAE
ncbi:DMT family transporter [Vallicoccus soli]|uniref:DMT family transporter n=1 Tax=Vallicoccus soli TaxID=2339232 RepID=A0A3A3YPL0_9ACTN|nr:DMT family transporter [Vallicoccus soli]RJK93160.1 DMT family transporter [Vallicoccus soli]